MRIEPKGKLRQWLVDSGREHMLDGFDISDERLEKFTDESHRLFPRHSEEFRECWAVYCALTHPGFKRSEMAKKVKLVDAVPDQDPVESTKPVPAAKSVRLSKDVLLYIWMSYVAAMLLALVLLQLR